MLLAAKDTFLTEGELRQFCDCTILGTDALQAVQALHRLGFPYAGKFNLSFVELQEQVERGNYPMVFVSLLPLDGLKEVHALVVIEIEQSIVHVLDPLQGERQLPQLSFTTAWGMMRNVTLLLNHE